MSFFNTLRHLLPRAKAWQLTIDSTLRQFISGLASSFDAVKDFIMDVFDDLWPSSTRELTAWEDQFGLGHEGTTAERRSRLDAAWSSTGGQSPSYLQTRLRDAGFDVYVYDWFDDPYTTTKTPTDNPGYSIVNLIREVRTSFYVYCSTHTTKATCGSAEATCGRVSDNVITQKAYDQSTIPVANYEYVNYIAGPAFPERALVKSSRRQEFEIMVLRYFPQYQWTIALVDFWGVNDLTTATYVSNSVATLAVVDPVDIKWKPLGDRAYILDASTGKVYQYDAGTAWSISSLDESTVGSFTLTTQNATPKAVFFNYNGTKMYMVGDTAPASVFQYTLSTPWDITTATYDTVSLNVSTEDTSPEALNISHDGSVLSILGLTNTSIYQYAMSTPWDLSTASLDGSGTNVSGADATPTGFDFSLDGGTLYLIGQTNDTVKKYTLTTAWDVSAGLTLEADTVDVSSETGTPEGVTFIPDGTKLHICGGTADKIYQYNIED